MPDLQLVSDFSPAGDQPQAIASLVEGLRRGQKHQVLLGATGTGKTYSIAQVIQAVQRPTLVMAHNKTLVAQLYQEFKALFPHNAVQYYVSYYDYYQPEAYIPRTDTYIEKESTINHELERMRHAATEAILTRRDVIIVASVSAIFALADPAIYGDASLTLTTGQVRNRHKILHHLVNIHYRRNDYDLQPGTFRVRGDTLEILPASQTTSFRVELFGDEVDRMLEINSVTGEIIDQPHSITLYPARHVLTDEQKLRQALADIEAELAERLAQLRTEDKLLEAQRLEQRTRYDLEMLREVGYCSGIEHYSRHLDQRPPGSTPWTLFDYFPDDYLLVIDESHMTLPQIRGMYNGDQARKRTLVDHGFRLPSALDNRPLTFAEWESRLYQTIYTSATPGPYERQHADRVVEQIIRPTGLLDPAISIRPSEGQIDDLIAEVQQRVERGQRALITTLTKRMAEDLTDYMQALDVSVQYLHSDVDTLERSQILRELRLGVYDVVVGINLLREGLDLPEVSLVAILDADKEGFLRSESALIQTIGRAARHLEGTVIMYADQITPSMQRALDETNRRRARQIAYNQTHQIEPRSVVKEIQEVLQADSSGVIEESLLTEDVPLQMDDIDALITALEIEMQAAAADLAFEKAASLRDQISELRRHVVPG